LKDFGNEFGYPHNPRFVRLAVSFAKFRARNAKLLKLTYKSKQLELGG
jgi:hypothetical protein